MLSDTESDSIDQTSAELLSAACKLVVDRALPLL